MHCWNFSLAWRAEPRFLAVHGQCRNPFPVGGHLLSAGNYRLLPSGSYQTGSKVTCV